MVFMIIIHLLYNTYLVRIHMKADDAAFVYTYMHTYLYTYLKSNIIFPQFHFHDILKNELNVFKNLKCF